MVPPLPLLFARNRFEEEAGVVKFMRAHQGEIKLLVDSGAYAYWKRNDSRTVENYMSWLDRCPFVGDDYIQLDVIGDVNQTRRNLDIMLQKGFRPWPVFQRGAPEHWLAELAQLGPVVAVGCGIGVKGYRQYAAYWAWEAARQEIPVHLLGVLDLGMIRRYAPFSCDSSGAFATAGRFGRLEIADRNYYHGDKISPRDQQLIRSLGFDPGVLRDPGAWKVAKRNKLSCYSQQVQYAVLSRLVTKVEGEFGTVLYGVVSDYQARIYLEQWRTYHERRARVVSNQQGV